MKAYKGFNADMTCTPVDGVSFQYEEGKTYEMDEAILCHKGFHACENPLDTFGYYAPGKGAVYHEVELGGVTDDTKLDDSKRCGTKITIGARLSVLDLCKLHFEYTKERTTNSDQGKDYTNLSAQSGSSLAAWGWSSLAARDWSSLAALDRSSLAARDNCKLSAGENSVLAAWNSVARAGKGTLIALGRREYIDGVWTVTDFKAAIVDGETIKADAWYKLQDGEFVEVEEE